MSPPSLAQLRARPRDRDLRLVYADWLQGRGDPHGELIAIQDVEASCTSEAIFVDARARALIETHASVRPAAPADVDGRPRGVWACWDRGFVRRLELLVDRPSPGIGLRRVMGLIDELAARLGPGAGSLAPSRVPELRAPSPRWFMDGRPIGTVLAWISHEGALEWFGASLSGEREALFGLGAEQVLGLIESRAGS